MPRPPFKPTLKLILECVLYYILGCFTFVLLITDKLYTDTYNAVISPLDVFVYAPTSSILLGIVVGILAAIYPIVREYIKHTRI